MPPLPEQYVFDESVLLRAIIDPDSAAADALTHLMRSKHEIGVMPDRVAKRFLEFSSTGILIEARHVDPPIDDVSIPAHLIAQWIGAHAALFSSSVPPPSSPTTSDSDLRPSLQEVVATAIECGAKHVISEYPVANAFVDEVLIITSRLFYDIADPR